MLPLFKKTHIDSRAIEDYVKCGYIRNYSEEAHKRNALRQAGLQFRLVNDELYRHGTEKEYARYGLRMVIHDDEPEKKSEIIRKCHVDDASNHFGMNITLKNVTETYYWQGISSHVKMFMKQCDLCKVRSKLTAEDWFENEKQNQAKRKNEVLTCKEAKQEIKNLGRIKKSTPPETFFIVNAEKKLMAGIIEDMPDSSMMIDSNNIEYVVETLGHSEDGTDLPEICHVLNVPDIVPMPDRYRSREIERFLKYGTYPEDFTANQRNGLKNPATQYTIVDGELYHDVNKKGSKGVRQVIHDDMPALKVKVIVENHMDEDGSHCGMNRTISKIGEKYFWTGLSIDMRRFMMNCRTCCSNRSRKAVHTVNDNMLSGTYKHQIDILKSKHNQKMAMPLVTGETEVEEVQAIAFGEEEGAVTEEVPLVGYVDTQDHAQNTYNQVIRLIGPNKEVTEITVAVVKTNADDAVSNENVQEVQEISMDKGEDNIQMVTDGTFLDNQVEVVETEHFKDDEVPSEETESSVKQETLEMQSAEGDVQENTEEYVQETEQNNEGNKIAELSEEQKESLNDKQSEEPEQGAKDYVVESEVNESDTHEEVVVENDDDLVQVVVINDDGREEHKTFRRDELQAVTDLVAVAEQFESEAAEKADQVEIETTTEETADCLESQSVSSFGNGISGQYYYHDNVVFTPKTSRTKSIVEYLQTGYAHACISSRLSAIKASFQLADGLLCRKQTPYKTGQVVIHDDNPELKLKLISRYHLKPNGAHCSPKVTYAKLLYDYWWEEMRWDVHRYYSKCDNCVINGIDIRTRQSVRTAQEEKKLQSDKTLSMVRAGKKAQGSRNFRQRVQKKLDKFKQWERFGKSNMIEEEEGCEAVYMNYETVYDEAGENEEMQMDHIEVKIDGTVQEHLVQHTDTGDESDVEIHLPDSDDETSQTNNDVVIILQKPDGKALNLATPIVKIPGIVQPQNQISSAVATINKNKVTVLSPDVPAKVIASKPAKEVGQSTVHLLEERAKATEVGSPDRQQKNTPKSPMKISEMASPSTKRSGMTLPVVITQGPSMQVQHETTARSLLRPSNRSSETIAKPAGKTPTIIVANKKPTEVPVTSLSSSPTKTAKTPVGDVHMTEENKGKSTKRSISEVESPVSEGRRPRREIKRPRRYDSPDTDEKLSNTPIKTEYTESQRESRSSSLSTTPARKQVFLRSGAEKDLNKSSIVTDNIIVIKQEMEKQEKQKQSGKKEIIWYKPKYIENIEGMDNDTENDSDYLGSDMDDYGDDDFDDEAEQEGMEETPAIKVLLSEGKEIMEVVKTEVGFSCSLCKAVFRTERSCKQHGAKNACFNECKYCGKCFKKCEIGEYEEHVARHKTGQQFPCHLCYKTFYEKCSLDMHQLLHGGVKQLECAECSDMFYTSFQQAAHMYQKHKKCLAFKCDVCHAKFVNISFMKSQVMFDGELSFFKCVMCDNTN